MANFGDPRTGITTKRLEKLGRTVAPLLLVACMAVLFFRRLLLSNLLLARGDPFLYFYPYWDMAAESIRSGRIPLWNPNIFMGAPLLANSQVGFFYPLNWPGWLLLSTPYAFSLSVFIHVLIGCTGAFFAARRGAQLSRPAAFLAAILFGLGGYFTAQIEHINQLQGMAWLPWFLVALATWKSNGAGWRSITKLTLTMAALFTLQMLAGHIQAVLITAVFVFLWQLIQMIAEWKQQNGNSGAQVANLTSILRTITSYFAPLFAGMILAAFIAAVQLAPTLELIQYSGRQGGLSPDEALSFSLHPLLLARALLPNYGEPLFIEYVTVLPLAGLLLSVIGAWFGKNRLVIISLIAVAGLGLFLALGIFNPLNQIVIRIPGFNLFRVPARWLLLYAMAMALLGGAGLDEIIRANRQGKTWVGSQLKRPLAIGISLLSILILWAFISVPLARVIPIGAEASASRPDPISLIAWIIELTLAVLFIVIAAKTSRLRGILLIGLVAIPIIALFAGTRNLPYNNPTTPEAFFDQRPPSLRLETEGTCDEDNDICTLKTGRFLSLSNIFFDVGDQAEIDTIYDSVLSKTAQYDYTVAIKQKEILAPNLPMIYDLSSVDGFDGGVLPLQAYNDATSLLLPPGISSSDGRLREHLPSIPEDRWLDLFNAEFVITDKVGDLWQKDVFFDLQFPTSISSATGSVPVGSILPFEATELWLMVDGEPGSVDLNFVDGVSRELVYRWLDENLLQVSWPDPGTPAKITLNPCNKENSAITCDDPWQLLSLALVDSRDGTFQPLVAGEYRLIHSGDTKIYKNLDVLPRAYLLDKWVFTSSSTETLEIMKDPSFDPRRLAVIQGEGPDPSGERGDGHAQIISYEPEKVVINTESEEASLLLLTDANYPGWQATIDGVPTPIYQADVLFRGVFVPAGDHLVEYTFESKTFTTGWRLSLAGLSLWLLLAFIVFRSERNPGNSELKAAGFGSVGEQVGDDR